MTIPTKAQRPWIQRLGCRGLRPLPRVKGGGAPLRILRPRPRADQAIRAVGAAGEGGLGGVTRAVTSHAASGWQGPQARGRIWAFLKLSSD